MCKQLVSFCFYFVCVNNLIFISDSKVQHLPGNQKEMLHLLRELSPKLDGGDPVDVQDLLPNPLKTVQQFSVYLLKAVFLDE